MKLVETLGQYEVFEECLFGVTGWVVFLKDDEQGKQFFLLKDAIKYATEQDQERAHEADEDCGHEGCEECCAHVERDHGICLDCGHEQDPGEAIDRAMDYGEDR